MSQDIDYRAVEVPDDKGPTEYTYAERRAEILALIEEAGHPRAINQSRLAERYGCAQSNISNDVDRLREYITATIDEETVDAITETVYQKSVQELMSNGEYKDAVKAVESWNDWLMKRGRVEKEPEQHEVDGSGIVLNLDGDE
jgi:transposase-like protein